MTTRKHQEARPKGTEGGGGEITPLPVALIDHDPGQPRKTMNPTTLEGLAANIREHGLQQAIHVRPGETGRYVVLIGARRLAAFQLLGWEHIPAIVHAVAPEPGELRLLQLSENLLREDVNPMEQALAFKECLNGGTASALAAKLGVSVATVTNALALADRLPADVQELVRQGALPGTVARELTRARLAEDQRELARRYVAGELRSRSELTAALRAARDGAAAAPPAAAGLVFEEAGIRLSIALPAGGDLAAVEAAIKELGKEMRRQRGRSVVAFQDYLDARAKTAHAVRKAAELKAAQEALAAPSPPFLQEQP